MRCKINQVYLEKHKVKVVVLHFWVFTVRYFQFESISFVIWAMTCHCKAAQSSTTLSLSVSITRAAEYLLFEK